MSLLVSPLKTFAGLDVVAKFKSLFTPRSKRRRNTAASARFRMKKKEREQALERHAKDLEDRLNKMERDMDGLRKGESRVFPQQSSP